MNTDTEAFVEFPKIARLSREVVVTEKIDGTNGVIYITEAGEMRVGSRTRWLTPETGDNAGFLLWAMTHKDELMQLGVGRHFGEWWGSGIQRGYGLPKGEKRFSLFNVIRWHLHGEEPKRIASADPRVEKYQERLPACCSLVPELWRGVFSTEAVDACVRKLDSEGSAAAPGFMKPEGVVVFHIAGNVGFKKTILKDEERKGKSL